MPRQPPSPASTRRNPDRSAIYGCSTRLAENAAYEGAIGKIWLEHAITDVLNAGAKDFSSLQHRYEKLTKARPLEKVTSQRFLLPALVHTSLTSAIVSSLGMLLVPRISEERTVSISTAQWMLTVNLLVDAVATPVIGRLSDGSHKKRLLR